MQRVAIGRALVRRPAIFLMDEPLSSLDAKLRGELRLELKRIQQELGATILYVTHDQTEAMTMANRIGVMDAGPARAGRHAARDLREPVRHLRRDPARQPGASIWCRARCFAGLAAPAGAATIGVRTEHVRIRKAANGVGGGARHVDRASGRPNHLHVDHRGADLVTLADPDSRARRGRRGRRSSCQTPLFFDADGQRGSRADGGPDDGPGVPDEQLIEAVAAGRHRATPTS